MGIDGGVNLTNPKFHQNTEYVIARALHGGVQKMVVTGLKLNGSKSAAVMAQTRPNVLYAAVGIHPHFVKDDWNDRAAEPLEDVVLILTVNTRQGICKRQLSRSRWSLPSNTKRHCLFTTVTLTML